MASDTPPTPAPETGRAEQPSRRRFLGIAAGVVGAGLLATSAGVIAATELTSATSTQGRRVDDLLNLPGFIVAHRGGSADWPEMSAYAYQQAVKAGANALEISLARSSDGVWFGLHDATLDRTSGTSGYLPAQHSWAEISQLRISPKGTVDPHQAARPYLRFENLVKSYGATHTIFVDPKFVPARYYPELLHLMRKLVDDPSNTFIGKGFSTSVEWAAAAHDAGLTTWGFYYGSQLQDAPLVLPATEPVWDLLGLDVQAPSATWSTVLGYHKKTIAHVIATDAEAKKALALGASGLMVSGISEVIRGK